MRPLTRRATRIFVIVSILLVLAASAYSAYMLVWSVNDPELLDRKKAAQEAVQREGGDPEAESADPASVDSTMQQ